MSTPRIISTSEVRTGMRFGRWLVVGPPHRGVTRREAFAPCRCDCGTTRDVSSYRLRSGGSLSCGCLSAELSGQRRNRLRHGHARDTARSPEYDAWSQMRMRCLQATHRAYPSYGGRGIAICERWGIFENFLADMGPRPSSIHSLDRIDNERGYEPGNCRWATQIQQSDNRRSSVRLTWNGETKSIAQWARDMGVSRGVLARRLKLGWTPERAFSAPVRVVRRRACA